MKSLNSHTIRPKTLIFCLFLIVIFALLLILKHHDAILVVALHLNFKISVISDMELQCEKQQGAKTLIHRNEHPPRISYSDNCDRSHLSPVTDFPDEHSSYDELELFPSVLENLSPGGHFAPNDCSPAPENKLAIIIPHRDREMHLKQLLYVLHPVLQQQKIDYTVFIMQQAGSGIFNKARLLNAGVQQALLQDPEFNCFIFHDVDLLIKDERNFYFCDPNVARHISGGVDKYEYKLPYDGLFGGVVAMSKGQFERINGYSNHYWVSNKKYSIWSLILITFELFMTSHFLNFIGLGM